MIQAVQPGKGYSNGMEVRPGPATRVVHVAGQIGAVETPEGRHKVVDGGFAAQFGKALENILAVLSDCGMGPQNVAEMTVYVTDMAAYRNARAQLSEVWRTHMHRYYPAMTLVAVRELFEPGAMVEIRAVAYDG